MTPGEYKTGGAKITIQYSIEPSPFGDIFIDSNPRVICRLSFLTDRNKNHQIGDLQQDWPGAQIENSLSEIMKNAQSLLSGKQNVKGPLSLHVTGTNFQIAVWRALLQIDPAAINSYSQVATAVGRPKASRAVGTAIGSNPVAFFIPCHRVLQQNGKIGGYLWGETRKHAIHAWESARYS
jgi:AraC family transcriptional regulator of adaptative response/methylated-DNA-[protein]-cysteine methyltransferase